MMHVNTWRFLYDICRYVDVYLWKNKHLLHVEDCFIIQYMHSGPASICVHINCGCLYFMPDTILLDISFQCS